MKKLLAIMLTALSLGISGLAVAADAPADAAPMPAVEAPAAEVAVAAEAAPEVKPEVHKGDVAWMMTATVLVVFMVVPGLALFYGGLVRAKNMLSVLMQVLVVFSLITVLWAV